ncbi:MAG: hypothetical protein WBQ44_01770 [Rhodococcus sp. (in: high G+C Gram-positive bacteria)]
MTITTLILLALAAAASIVPVGPRTPNRLTAGATVILLGAAAVTGSFTGPAEGFGMAATYVVTTLAAILGGSTIVTAVFRVARRNGNPGPDEQAGPLHGGRTIGALERAAVAASILSGWPEGIAIVLAVKGLARYPELRADEHRTDERPAPGSPQTPAASSASEQFIIGTFTSVMWAVAVCGVGRALLT